MVSKLINIKSKTIILSLFISFSISAKEIHNIESSVKNNIDINTYDRDSIKLSPEIKKINIENKNYINFQEIKDKSPVIIENNQVFKIVSKSSRIMNIGDYVYFNNADPDQKFYIGYNINDKLVRVETQGLVLSPSYGKITHIYNKIDVGQDIYFSNFDIKRESCVLSETSYIKALDQISNIVSKGSYLMISCDDNYQLGEYQIYNTHGKEIGSLIVYDFKYKYALALINTLEGTIDLKDITIKRKI